MLSASQVGLTPLKVPGEPWAGTAGEKRISEVGIFPERTISFAQA